MTNNTHSNGNCGCNDGCVKCNEVFTVQNDCCNTCGDKSCNKSDCCNACGEGPAPVTDEELNSDCSWFWVSVWRNCCLQPIRISPKRFSAFVLSNAEIDAFNVVVGDLVVGDTGIVFDDPLNLQSALQTILDYLNESTLPQPVNCTDVVKTSSLLTDSPSTSPVAKCTLVNPSATREATMLVTVEYGLTVRGNYHSESISAGYTGYLDIGGGYVASAIYGTQFHNTRASSPSTEQADRRSVTKNFVLTLAPNETRQICGYFDVEGSDNVIGQETDFNFDGVMRIVSYGRVD